MPQHVTDRLAALRPEHANYCRRTVNTVAVLRRRHSADGRQPHRRTESTAAAHHAPDTAESCAPGTVPSGRERLERTANAPVPDTVPTIADAARFAFGPAAALERWRFAVVAAADCNRRS